MKPNNEGQNEKQVAITIPGAAKPINTMWKDGTQWVSVTHVSQALGLDAKSQRRKLQARSWVTAAMMTLQVGDQKRRLYMVDRRTLFMWLITINTNRVKPEVREHLEAYQEEMSEVISAYFDEGVAINPRATEEQLDNVSDAISVHQQQLELLKMAEGLIDPDHLKTKTQTVLGNMKALGHDIEHPTLSTKWQIEEAAGSPTRRAG